MISPTLRQEFIEALENLSDEQVSALLSVAKVMQPSPERDQPYDEAKDTLIGFWEGPEDFASRSEEIVHDTTKDRGAWTQKDSASE